MFLPPKAVPVNNIWEASKVSVVPAVNNLLILVELYQSILFTRNFILLQNQRSLELRWFFV